MLLKYVFILVFVARGLIYSQSTPQKFIDALIHDKPEIMEYVNKEELKRSQRLGIEYNGVKNKFIIGVDIPQELKEDIKNGKYKYEIAEKPLSDSFTEVTFKVPDANYSKVFYFLNGFIATSSYRSHLWEKAGSKYFSYRLQEPKYFNDYCKLRLDEFVDMVADTLGFTISEKRLLEKEKIIYTFCADESEVENITGFKAKGIAILGSDEIVTSYQTHFHEVAHLLINYKLKKLGLYTLPFFMEGFAVALGGRGGMAPRVVTDVGYYLQKTGFLTYDSILTHNQFYSTDANMSYAVSGLYNSFLLNELGGEKYLELYRNMNGSVDFVKNIEGSSLNLPDIAKWDSFLVFYNDHPDVFFDINDNSEAVRIGNAGYVPVFKNGNVKFFISRYQFVGFDELKEDDKGYFSRLFISMFPLDSLEACNPAEIGLFVDSISVNVINFYNDEVIVNYIKNLSVLNNYVPYKDHKFEFFIKELAMKKFNTKGFHISGFVILNSLISK
jgi:hypothetical protein